MFSGYYAPRVLCSPRLQYMALKRHMKKFLCLPGSYAVHWCWPAFRMFLFFICILLFSNSEWTCMVSICSQVKRTDIVVFWYLHVFLFGITSWLIVFFLFIDTVYTQYTHFPHKWQQRRYSFFPSICQLQGMTYIKLYKDYSNSLNRFF